MADTKEAIVTKRPKKEITIAFILSQFSCLGAKVPGVTKETIKAQLAHGNYFLYQNEVEAILTDDKIKADKSFDPKGFIEMLAFAGAVKQGQAPRLTDSLVRINSQERALEVANNPGDPVQVQKIKDYMSDMLAIRDKINPLVNEKATVSIALKNKVVKEDEKEPAKEVAKKEPDTGAKAV
jgi:hypothetical protein